MKFSSARICAQGRALANMIVTPFLTPLSIRAGAGRRQSHRRFSIFPAFLANSDLSAAAEHFFAAGATASALGAKAPFPDAAVPSAPTLLLRGPPARKAERIHWSYISG